MATLSTNLRPHDSVFIDAVPRVICRQLTLRTRHVIFIHAFCFFLLQVDARQPVTEVAPQTKPAEEKKEEASDAVQSIAVRQKLKELESEIDKFRTENAVLAKMRTEREEVRENLL